MIHRNPKSLPFYLHIFSCKCWAINTKPNFLINPGILNHMQKVSTLFPPRSRMSSQIQKEKALTSLGLSRTQSKKKSCLITTASLKILMRQNKQRHPTVSWGMICSIKIRESFRYKICSIFWIWNLLDLSTIIRVYM